MKDTIIIDDPYPYACYACGAPHDDPATHRCPAPTVGQRWRVDGITDTVRTVEEMVPDSMWIVTWDRDIPVRYVRPGVAAKDAVVWPPHRAQRVHPIDPAVLEEVCRDMLRGRVIR